MRFAFVEPRFDILLRIRNHFVIVNVPLWKSVIITRIQGTDDLDMPEKYKAIPTPTATRSREGDDTAPSESHREDSWTHSFFLRGKQVRMKWCGPKRPRNREEVKRPNTRGSKRELALANANKTENRSAEETVVLSD